MSSFPCGWYMYTPVDLKKSFELLTTKKVNVAGLSTTYSLDNIVKAFDDTISNKILKAYIELNKE